MNTRIKTTLISTLALFLGGCDSKDVHQPGAPPAAPDPEFFSVSITAIDIVNKDSGETIHVDGVPVQGGVLKLD